MNEIYLNCEQVVRERKVIGRIWTSRNLSSQILLSLIHFSIQAFVERLKLEDHVTTISPLAQHIHFTSSLVGILLMLNVVEQL